MNCPIFYFAFPRLGKDIDAINMKCLEKDCAWWDNDRNICAVKSIFHDLTNIRIELREIKEKMPHEKQFRR